MLIPEPARPFHVSLPLHVLCLLPRTPLPPVLLPGGLATRSAFRSPALMSLPQDSLPRRQPIRLARFLPPCTCVSGLQCFPSPSPLGWEEGLGWVIVISRPQGLVHGMCLLSVCIDVDPWVHREGSEGVGVELGLQRAVIVGGRYPPLAGPGWGCHCLKNGWGGPLGLTTQKTTVTG